MTKLFIKRFLTFYLGGLFLFFIIALVNDHVGLLEAKNFLGIAVGWAIAVLAFVISELYIKDEEVEKLKKKLEELKNEK